MLAYYFYSFGKVKYSKEYSEDDLKNPETLKDIFDLCQILEAYITKEGWEFLIHYYGYEKLYEIDQKSGWLSERTENTLEEYIHWVDYEIEFS